MAATAMIHFRVDEEVKTQATETLAAMGLSVSDAVRVFLIRVAAEKALPFELRVPNAATRARNGRGRCHYTRPQRPFRHSRGTIRYLEGSKQ